MLKYLPLLWAGLKRRKLRSALTLLSVGAAFVLFAFLGALREAFLGGVALAGRDRLITRHKVSLIQTLPVAHTDKILAIPGVAGACHSTWFGGIYQDPKNFFATIAVVPEDFLALYPEFVLSAGEIEQWRRTRNGAIVGRSTAERFGWKPGDRIPLRSPIYGEPAGASQWEFVISGIFTGAKKGTDTTGFYFRYDYFDEARQAEKGMVGWFTVRVADPDRAADIAVAIDEEFANSPFETKTEPEGAFAAGFVQQIGDINTIVLAVTGAVFFTILLVAGNTMAQSVRERTGELGVLKALGFTNGGVMALVLAESCLIALAGAAGGLTLAWALLNAGNPVPSLLPVLYVPVQTLAGGVLLALALGLTAGLPPAWQALRLQIAGAMRRET
jgi:putative ABC transport system permease protein